VRVLRWQARAVVGRLDDAKPGPEIALHALLPWEREAIVKISEEWLEIDRSHRKLAHRGSRVEAFYASESTVLRVLQAAGIKVAERPARERRPRRGWPEWAELVPGVITIYDFTHFRGVPSWCAIAVLDVVSRYWLATLVSPEETSTQVEVAYTRALEMLGKAHLLDDEGFLAELRGGQVPDHAAFPVLPAVSDNGPQMTSSATRTFMAGARIAQHLGRPGTPNDQAWIESLFGHVKDEFPHLDKIADPGELDSIRTFNNEVRLHSGIGYHHPVDVHYGRAAAVRDRRAAILATAQAAHPERFASGGIPTPPDLPGPAWINKPKNENQKDTTEKPTQN
jgi:transposase InsO family protein